MRYVCFHCLGTGKTVASCTRCDKGEDHAFEQCDAGGEVPCQFCAKRNRPPALLVDDSGRIAPLMPQKR